MCEFCNTKFYVQVERYSKPILAPLTEVEELECELINKTGFQYMQIQNNYCPLCRKEAGRVSTEKPIERPIELLRKISKEIYDNEFYIETAILSYQAQEEKTYTFFRDDEQKDELRKYSWCQRPDSTNMSLKRFTENGEIEGYMSESLAEHYGLQKVDLNEFIHKFVKPLVKYKLELEEESYDK